ncbi:response regulator [Catenovulum sp. SM1970]|nr:response regulator [Marinifaba aquimaris]
MLSISQNKAEFTWCKTLSEVAQVIEKERFDIYLLDLYLPDGHSIEFCRTINTPQKTDSITVLITGESDLEWRLRAFEAGAENYIQKNIKQDALKIKLDSLFNYQADRLLALKSAQAESKKHLDQSVRSQLDHNALVHFYRQCLNLNNIDKIERHLASLMQSWHLNYIARFTLTDGTEYHFKAHNEAICEMELELFNELNANGPNVQSFGNSSYFRYKQAELIVKNMPKDSYSRGSLID